MPDLRLAVPAVALWIGCAVLVGAPAASVGTALAGALGAVVAVAAAVAASRTTRGRIEAPGPSRLRPASLCALLAVALAALALGAALVAANAPGRTSTALDTAADRSDSVRATLVIERAPHRMASGFGTSPRWSLRGHTTGEASVPVTVQFDASVARARALSVGTTVRADGTALRNEPGEATSYTIRTSDPHAVAVLAPPPPWLAWTAEVRTAFAVAAANTPGDGGALLPGLAIGDETTVPPALDEAMTASSLSHLTAVSGANCALVIALVFAAARLLGLGRRTRVAAALIALAAFVALVGPGPSVIRAAAMAVVVLVGLLRGRPADGVPALALAMIVLLVHDPWLSRDYGFALSVLATAGLLVLAGPLARTFARWMPRGLALVVAVPTAAQLACQPVLVLLSPTLPLFGIPANLLAEPAAPVATILGCLACALLPVARALGDVLVRLAWLPSAWIAQVATFASGLPGAALPWVEGAAGAALAALVLIAVAVLVLARRVPRPVLLAAAIGLCAGVVVYGAVIGGSSLGRVTAIPTDWQIAACDVGQGDGLLLRDGDAVAMIDVGRKPEPAAACLDRLGVARLDVLVLTHFDADHVGGVAGVASRAQRALVQRPVRDADERTLAVLRGAGVPLEQGHAGMGGRLGGVTWRLLWPLAEGPPSSGASPSGSGMDTGNPGSLTVEAEGHGIRSIFLGDLGEEAQNAVLATRSVRPVDVVKVAHHGSADQSPDLYRALRPALGLVSVGAHNGYGHPTRRALDILASVGAAVARTDRQGLLLVSPPEPGGHGVRLWSERAAVSAGGRPYPGEGDHAAADPTAGRGETWRPEAAADAVRARRAPPRARSRRCRGTRSERLPSCSSRARRASSPSVRSALCATRSRPTTRASRSATSTPATMRPGNSSRSRAPPCSGSRG